MKFWITNCKRVMEEDFPCIKLINWMVFESRCGGRYCPYYFENGICNGIKERVINVLLLRNEESL